MSEIRKSVDNPLFSIIIPTYNYAHTLERAIHSVFKQNKESFELLVINDGSKDNTEELLSDLQKKVSIIFVLLIRATEVKLQSETLVFR